MAKTDALYELIHALSRGEKKKFTLLSHRSGKKKKPNYLILFEAISAMPEWNAAKLKKKIEGSFPLSALAYEKNNLFNLILDSLLHQHIEQPEIYLSLLLCRARILLEKGRMDSSVKILDYAECLANEQQNRIVCMEILELRISIASQYGNAEQLIELSEQEERILEELENYRSYNLLLGKLVRAAAHTPHSRRYGQKNGLAVIMKHPLLKNENRAKTLPAKILFHHIHSYYNYLIKRRDLVKACNREIVQLLDLHPDYTRVHLSDYLSAISNLITDALFVKSKDDLINSLNRLAKFHQNFPGASELIVESHRQLYLEARLRIYNQWGRFEDSALLIGEAEEILNGSVLVKGHRKIHLIFHSALALFGTGKYKTCLRWLQELADIPEVPHGAAIYYSMGMFLRLMALIELGREDVTEQQCQSFRNFLESRNLLNLTEKYLLDFLPGLAHKNTSERRESFEEAKVFLDEISGNPNELPMVHALDFLRQWIDQKAMVHLNAPFI